MALKQVEFVISRSGESTIAVVRALMDPGKTKTTVNGLLDVVRKAVSKWVLTTRTGSDAWKRSSADFNIGDLATEQPLPRSLQQYLKKLGVTKFDISTFGGTESGDWVFDTVLMDDASADEFLRSTRHEP